MIYVFLSNNPSSGDINLSNLPCKTWLSQHGNRPYGSKVDFGDINTNIVHVLRTCVHYSYCVTEFETVFRSFIFWRFCLYHQ